MAEKAWLQVALRQRVCGDEIGNKPAINLLKALLSRDPLPPVRLCFLRFYNYPKQRPYLGTKYSNTLVYGEHSTFQPQ